MNLNELYQQAIEQQHWVYSKWFPEYQRYVQEYLEQAGMGQWTDEVLHRFVKKTTDNGVSNLKQGNFKNDEYDSIKANWSTEFQPEIRTIAVSSDRNEIKRVYDTLDASLRGHTKQHRRAGTNKIVAGLLPGVASTVVDHGRLKKVIKNLQPYFDDCPPIENHWLLDNFNFVDFCKRKVNFQHEWHVSLFGWFLYDFFENNGVIMEEISNELIDECSELLLANKNLILTGAPGTGKTYLAKKIAEVMDAKTEFVQFHPSFDYTDFVEGLRPIKKSQNDLGFELKDGIFKSFCKTALINQIESSKRPEEVSREKQTASKLEALLEDAMNIGRSFNLKGGNSFSVLEFDEKSIKVSVPDNDKTSELSISLTMLLELLLDDSEDLAQVSNIRKYYKRKHNYQQDSYLYTFYHAFKGEIQIALETSQEVTEKEELNKYVFIIDEINRAEISKVFGELFYSVDPGYRGVKGRVKTQYSNLQEDDDVFKEGFYIPENVYIIGTMNDIDRSVESFDFAMRRRFAWKEIKASDRMEMWDGEIDEWVDEARSSLLTLNKAIEEVPGLNEAYHVGPAYYLKLSLYNGDFDQLWANHIEGILFEYLRGMPNADGLLATLKEAFYPTVSDEEVQG
ncbi:McrB family protein [Flammeovirga sp. SJP92]|uniref:McrB family protein n=1 Tax=Flammeovirga sp. SJP92 TaxID=1775430 RepID=UPI0007883654|nr:AAA family ATPase [Flammeovirga sp. SJP92]KXX69200.1 hypothetical protein AVL50_16485 [Flammeovirga sp. SJP92]